MPNSSKAYKSSILSDYINPTGLAVFPSIVRVSGSLLVQDVPVSVSGHNHTVGDIINFNSQVSGLLPNNIVTGVGTSGYSAQWNSNNSLTSGIIFSDQNNVGIGTITPNSTLHVIGSGIFTSGIRIGDSAANSYIIGPSGNTYIRFNSGANNSINISSNTTTGSSTYLDTQFTYLNSQATYVNGSFTFPAAGNNPTSTATQQDSNSIRLFNKLWDGSAVMSPANEIASKASTTSNLSSRLAFLMQNGDGTQNRTERVSILNNGNLGIGTTAPQNLIHISGSTANAVGLRIDNLDGQGGSINADNGALYFNSSSATVCRMQASKIRLGDGVTGAAIELTSNGTISQDGNGGGLSFSGTTARLSNGLHVTSGDVGIGTTSPAAAFNVIGNAQLGTVAPNASDRTLLITGYDNPIIEMNCHNNWARHRLIGRVNGGLEYVNAGSISQNSSFTVGSTASSGSLRLYNNNDSIITMGMNTSLPIAYIGAYEEGDNFIGGIRFRTRSSISQLNDVYINRLGYLGIGTLSPSAQLSVIGSGIFSSGIFINNTPVSISGHNHISSDITNFNTSVSGLINGIYAPLNSAALTGTPTAPTAASGTNTTQIASTAFVRTEISNLVASAPSTLDTLNELATALGNDANFSTTITNSLAGKANLSGAAFTGAISAISGSFVSGINVVNQGGGIFSMPSDSNNILFTNTSGNVWFIGDGAGGSNVLARYQEAATGPIMFFRKYRGSYASPSPAVSGDILGALTYNTNNFAGSLANPATIQVTAESSPASGQPNISAEIRFSTAQDSDNSPVRRMTIKSNGFVGVGTTNPSGQLHVAGNGVFSSGIYSANGIFDNTLTVANIPVSISGHTHVSSNITDFNSSVSGLLPTIANSGDNRVLTSTGSSFGINAESNLTFDGTNLSAPYIIATYASGDEGGEIQLTKPPSGTLSGGITIDAYQNKLRFFEQGGAARGAYIDMTAAAAGVGTNLLTGPGSITVASFSATNGQPPATNFATLDTRNSIAVLDFDAATSESTVFVGVVPLNTITTNGLMVRLNWMATTATTGACVWGVQFEEMSTDTDADSFATAATATTTTNATSGIPTITEITITTIDGLVAGKFFRLKVYRDAAVAGDTMTGDAELISVEVRSI